MVRPTLQPLPRRKRSFSFIFSRFTDFGSGFSFGCRFVVVVYPRNFRFQGRSTALLSRFTFSRRRSLEEALQRRLHPLARRSTSC